MFIVLSHPKKVSGVITQVGRLQRRWLQGEGRLDQWETSSRRPEWFWQESNQLNKMNLEKAAGWPRQQLMRGRQQPPGKNTGSNSERITDFQDWVKVVKVWLACCGNHPVTISATCCVHLLPSTRHSISSYWVSRLCAKHCLMLGSYNAKRDMTSALKGLDVCWGSYTNK